MKPVAFDYEAPRDIATAVKLLAGGDGMAKVMAGGQSLGPMLNLRLAQPTLLVDVRGIEKLREVTETADALVLGACVTHAMIEDGAVPDVTRGLMASVAADVAYRAVRNRGTVGGSLCHADPAADWVSTLLLLAATAIIEGESGAREVGLERFMDGAFSTALGDTDVLTGIRVPRLSNAARWGYYKFCRKPGEFAEAIAAVLVDPQRKVCRAVIGATNGTPHLIGDASALVNGFDDAAALKHVDAAGVGDDPYERQIHYTALKRAVARMSACA